MGALPLVPAGILFAAINAFNEETYYRATLLSTLHEVIGTNHALMINAVFFGMGHYLYGSPPGVLGFLMAGFLGWLLGKSMLETKGMGWAWVMHFVMDVIVFTAYAVQWAAR
jgi:membrane protease YdiL (CAAX protease family)